MPHNSPNGTFVFQYYFQYIFQIFFHVMGEPFPPFFFFFVEKVYWLFSPQELYGPFTGSQTLGLNGLGWTFVGVPNEAAGQCIFPLTEPFFFFRAHTGPSAMCDAEHSHSLSPDRDTPKTNARHPRPAVKQGRVVMVTDDSELGVY